MVSNDTDARFPPNVGIRAMEIYFPSTFVDQQALGALYLFSIGSCCLFVVTSLHSIWFEFFSIYLFYLSIDSLSTSFSYALSLAPLEQHDGVPQGKYTIGLGQSKMGFCNDREDIHSICLTVVRNLMEKFNVNYNQVGRLEVGTETIIDKSKSVKSVLMQLFAESGNTEIAGIDTTNACYGGTAALFNAVNWIESSQWDGRLALVVAGDIAVYASGNARPTGGCGVVAMLLGPDAPLVMERGLYGTHMEHVYDFYKPDLSSEFPEVDGPLTIECYFRALDNCYQRYLDKLKRKQQQLQSGTDEGLSSFDYWCFHSPYGKLVQKSFARLAFNDFLRNPDAPEYDLPELAAFKGLKLEQTYFNKDVEKVFVGLSNRQFQEKVVPALYASKNIGNMYCGSLYASLCSLVSLISSGDLMGKRIGMFSYGSGLASSLFSLRVAGDVSGIAKSLDFVDRLDARHAVDPAEFEKACFSHQHRSILFLMIDYEH